MGDRSGRSDRRWRRALVFILLAAAPALGAELRLGGTGSALGPVARVAERYEAAHPGVRVRVLPSMGSRGGIRALADGKIDLALSARPLDDAERRAGLTAVEFARTPFVFVVRPDRPTRDLGLAELTEIFAGRTTQWPDGVAIRLVLRPATDSDNAILKAMSAGMATAVAAALGRPGMILAATDQEAADLVARAPGGLGTSTLSQVLAEGLPLTPLRLDGVIPSPASLADGSYPHHKSLFAVTRTDAPPAVGAFAAFLTSDQGRRVLEAYGVWGPR